MTETSFIVFPNIITTIHVKYFLSFIPKMQSHYMTECEYCEKSLDAGNNDGTHHAICLEEEEDRMQNGKCLKCGKNADKYPDSAFCNKCDDNSKYLDYTGPE